MPTRQGRYGRELRRLNLAMRMIAHNARTRTIRTWTGLSRPRVQDTSREYWATRDEGARRRPSGPSPSALAVFWQTRRLHREAAAMAGLFHLLGVLPSDGVPLDRRRLPDLLRGERLCLAYETYLSFVPEPRLSLEHAFLLVTELACGGGIALVPCRQCSTLILVDRHNASRPRCTDCAR